MNRNQLLIERLFNLDEMEIIVEQAVFNKFPEETRRVLEAQIKPLRRTYGKLERLRRNYIFV